MKHLSTLLQIIALLWLSTSWSVAGFVINPYRFSSPPAPPPGGDEHFASVVLLLHCDGTNGSTTFTDMSNSSHTMTAIGNAQVSTTSPQFGAGSALFDGSDDALTAGSSADWAFGTGDFTIEFFVRFNSVPSAVTCMLSNYPGWSVQWRNDGVTTGLHFLNFNTALGNGASWTPAANTWYYIAVKRSGTTLSFWIDGAQSGSNTTNSTNLSDSSNLAIGALPFGSSYLQDFAGRIDEPRITKGVALDVSSIPTTEFPDS